MLYSHIYSGTGVVASDTIPHLLYPDSHWTVVLSTMGSASDLWQPLFFFLPVQCRHLALQPLQSYFPLPPPQRKPSDFKNWNFDIWAFWQLSMGTNTHTANVKFIMFISLQWRDTCIFSICFTRASIIYETCVMSYRAPNSNTGILPLFFHCEVAFPEQAFVDLFAVAGWNVCNSWT